MDFAKDDYQEMTNQVFFSPRYFFLLDRSFQLCCRFKKSGRLRLQVKQQK